MSFISDYWILVASATATIVICKLIIRLIKKFREERQLATFPSAPSHWFTGHLHYVKNHDGTTLQFHVRCATEFKTCYIMRRGPLLTGLVLCHPDAIKVVQTSSAPKAPTYEFIKPFFGNGLVAANGNKWFRMRRLLTPAFHFEILRSYVQIFQDSTNTLLEKWLSLESEEVELFHHLSLMTLDSILKCALSYETDCQTQEEATSYIRAVYDASDEVLNRLMNPLLHSDIIYKMTAGAKRYSEVCAVTQAKAKEVIRERRATLQDSVEQEKLKKRRYLDFLDILLAARDESGNALTEEEITSEVMTFMFAGHDTTASSISWTLYNLARFPEQQEKCREEIDAVLGSKEEFEWCSARELLKVDSDQRICKGDKTRRGTWVTTHIFALHRNPHVWADPELSPNASGPNCIGQSFALAELKTTVAMILRMFELSVAPQNIIQDYEDLQPHLILRAKNGIVVNISPRSSS
ncbi:Leukotriene-B4 omega-hydroxylase 3 [Stylophora pistillata]|uniref:Leukotriene-B4 omega-hydroxylase 3 n=1 Tax=Stylophora pistillata TaxID=50429 RepID=A0A2B4RCT2_STYPI|nr:Leukotriene-B4 omega-hydroxylase 3 [Stylophora pistillata]